MDKWNASRLFVACLLPGMVSVLGASAYANWKRSTVIAVSPATSIIPLAGEIFVSEQIQLADMAALKALGFATVIAMRPDGEAAGQPASVDMEKAAKHNAIRFYYVPVPQDELQGKIAERAVSKLKAVLSTAPGPILLYCRSGRRAARTWSLVESSRANGLDAQSILAAVKAAGHSADDLEVDIRGRIARRSPSAGASQ